MMSPAQFVAKWHRVNLPERAASQEHFLDLCRLLGQPTPAEHDATGAEYAFEKGVEVTSSASKGSKGDRGFADVWWKGKFGWEYKRKDKYKTLDEAYRQLLQYREALESPPLLIVSDIGRIEIHTNFTGTKKEVHTITLGDLDQPESLALLRRVFTEPESFRPTLTAEKITQDVAADLGKVAEGLRSRGHDPHDTAHFLMKCMFCLFAEDVRLLPFGLFKTLLEKHHRRPADLTKRMADLFDAMRTGGAYGNDDIAFFNGGLFDDKPPLELTEGEIGLLNIAATQDWGAVEPAVFGTLFERSLDPAKRSQIGAHYTSREDILLVVEPVIMDPLRREWQGVQAAVQKELDRRRAAKTPKTKKDADAAINAALQAFVHRLSTITILDPACGSGNFLYVAIQQLLGLEKEVITFAARPDIALGLFPRVRPTQLRGIEINPYAAELAQVVIWIGYLQWMRDNGFKAPDNPILANLATIENRDAILKVDKQGQPIAKPAEWPKAEFIIGNPPYVGDKRMISELGEKYVGTLRSAYDSTLGGGVNLVMYWFEQARRRLGLNPKPRAGFLATTTIAVGANRTVIEAVQRDSEVFHAWSDKEWALPGADVRFSVVAFGDLMGSPIMLDGREVARINADLTSLVDVTKAHELREMDGLAFVGMQKNGPFEMAWQDAARLLRAGGNPTGKPNSAVLRPWLNGADLVRRPLGMWIIDFGSDASLESASGFQGPFEHVRAHVEPTRKNLRRRNHRERWWIFGEARPGMRRALAAKARFIATTRVAKHRLFMFVDAAFCPDSRLVVIASDRAALLGTLASSIHTCWTLANASWHGVGNDPTYNANSCFSTFPLPWPPGKEPAAPKQKHHALWHAISDAAKDLDTQRERWLNPPEWLEPLARRIDEADDFADVPEAARPLIRHSAIMAAAAADPRLKKRTLTNLYNERPTWLRLAHNRLDRAVLAAYAATDPKGDWDAEWAEVFTDTGAGQPLPADHALTTQRAEIEQRVLANLLRLNHDRAAKG